MKWSPYQSLVRHRSQVNSSALDPCLTKVLVRTLLHPLDGHPRIFPFIQDDSCYGRVVFFGKDLRSASNTYDQTVLRIQSVQRLSVNEFNVQGMI